MVCATSNEGLGAARAAPSGFSDRLLGPSPGRDAGVVTLFGTPLLAAARRPGGYELELGRERALARCVVNAGGLHADKVAALVGIDPTQAGYKTHWCKGSYFRYHAPLRLQHPVYPLPGRHSLGIHLTLDRRGGVRLGPDAEFVERADYSVDPARAAAFHEAVARYMEGLRPEALQPDTAGIRAKLTGPEGGWRDFVVAEESSRGLPGWVDLVGIESPGLTASLAIAEKVVELLRG